MLKGSTLIICCRAALISVLAPEMWGERRLRHLDLGAAVREELAENDHGVTVTAAHWAAFDQTAHLLRGCEFKLLWEFCQLLCFIYCYSDGHQQEYPLHAGPSLNKKGSQPPFAGFHSTVIQKANDFSTFNG